MGPNLKYQPWAYLSKQSEAEESADESRAKRENAAVDGVKVEKEEDDELLAEPEEGEEEDAEEAKEKLVSVDQDAEDTEDSDDAEDTRDADDKEADDEMKIFDQQFIDQNTTVRSNSSSGFSLSLTPQPLPIADDKVEYRFRLLSQNDLATTTGVETVIPEG